jgi:hypothetical protein
MSPPSVEPPVAWRVCVQPANRRPFDKEFRPVPRYTVHATLAEAELEKEHQRAQWGNDAAICVEPVYAARAERKRALAAIQDSLTASGWPIQHRPPHAANRRRK